MQGISDNWAKSKQNKISVTTMTGFWTYHRQQKRIKLEKQTNTNYKNNNPG